MGLGASTAMALLVLQQLSLLATSTDYCSLCQEHTMCMYKKTEPRRPCRTLPEERNKILDFHNARRNDIALGLGKGDHGIHPPAANMKELMWDEELATIAKAWINWCRTFGHDKCRNSERFHVGQNIATGSTSKQTLEEHMQGWFDEIKHLDPNDVDSFVDVKNNDGEYIGFYTQMVWANTSLIGCARSTSRDNKEDSERLYCNYGPVGNIPGARIYQRGPERTNCPEGYNVFNNEYTGLCSSRTSNLFSKVAVMSLVLVPSLIWTLLSL